MRKYGPLEILLGIVVALILLYVIIVLLGKIH